MKCVSVPHKHRGVSNITKPKKKFECVSETLGADDKCTFILFGIVVGFFSKYRLVCEENALKMNWNW